jgi:hypothetical protein
VIETMIHVDELQGRLGGHGMAGDLGHEGHVLAGRQARDQIVKLEHESHVIAPVSGEQGIVVFHQIAAAVIDAPRGGNIEAAQNVQQRRFAAAGGAQQHDELAFIQVEIDAAERVDVDLTHVIGLRDASCLIDRVGRTGRGFGGRICSAKHELIEN